MQGRSLAHWFASWRGTSHHGLDASESDDQAPGPVNYLMNRDMPGTACALAFLIDGPTHVVLTGDPADPRTVALANAAWRTLAPARVLMHSRQASWLAGAATPGEPAAYVCRSRVCDRPVTTPADLISRLAPRPR